jgi:ABC-type phosphate/phosphonate transport system substrate-binding protein
MINAAMLRHRGTAAHRDLSPAARAGPGQGINFGIISTESTQNLKSTWQPMLDDMPGRPPAYKVKAFFAPDYAGVIEGMRFNKVHVAWMGNKSAWRPWTAPAASVSPRCSSRRRHRLLER